MSSRWRKLWVGIAVASVVYNTSRLGYWPVACKGESMQPTLGSGIVLLRKFDYALPWLVPTLQRGDLVFFKTPVMLSRYNIKRIIAMENEHVQYTDQHGLSHGVLVPSGCVWVEGDNKAVSIDSRTYGPLPVNLITGKVLVRLLPLGQLGRIPANNAVQ